jgi:hypothetical protein
MESSFYATEARVTMAIGVMLFIAFAAALLLG